MEKESRMAITLEKDLVNIQKYAILVIRYTFRRHFEIFVVFFVIGNQRKSKSGYQARYGHIKSELIIFHISLAHYSYFTFL